VNNEQKDVDGMNALRAAEIALLVTSLVGLGVSLVLLKRAIRRHRWMGWVTRTRAYLISRRHVRHAATRVLMFVGGVIVGLTYLVPMSFRFERRLTLVGVFLILVVSCLADMIDNERIRRLTEIEAVVEVAKRQLGAVDDGMDSAAG
jgi:hypothetical protein